jgi:hypothetical protein
LLRGTKPLFNFSGEHILTTKQSNSRMCIICGLHMADLYAPLPSAFGADAVEQFFTPEQVLDVLAFVNSLAG